MVTSRRYFSYIFSRFSRPGHKLAVGYFSQIFHAWFDIFIESDDYHARFCISIVVLTIFLFRKMSRDSVSTTDGYIGLTERIQRIANKTPDRFKRNPVNDENRRPVEIGRKRPTLVSTYFLLSNAYQL